MVQHGPAQGRFAGSGRRRNNKELPRGMALVIFDSRFPTGWIRLFFDHTGLLGSDKVAKRWEMVSA